MCRGKRSRAHHPDSSAGFCPCQGHAPPKRLRGFSWRECFDGACVSTLVSTAFPGGVSTRVSTAGTFKALHDRMSRVRNGPAWGATHKHRLAYTRQQVDQPVSEGLGKIRGARGETTPYRVNRCLQGALGCFDESVREMGCRQRGNLGLMSCSIQGRAVKLITSLSSKHPGGEDGHCHHPWGNYV